MNMKAERAKRDNKVVVEMSEGWMNTWVYALGLSILVFLVWDWFTPHLIQHASSESDPLYQKSVAFMTNDRFEFVKNLVLSHPIISNETEFLQISGLNSRVQTWAKGNRAGFRKLCYSSDLRFLCADFLQKEKIDETNAFVLKVFIGMPNDYNMSASYFSSSMSLQGTEDEAPLEDKHNTWVPYAHSILDIEVPKGIIGGQLQLFEDGDRDNRGENYAKINAVAIVEEPRPNTLHRLRGDTYFKWTDYSMEGSEESDDNRRRISLIFQQYKIANASYAEVTELKLWEHKASSEKPVYAFSIVLWSFMGVFLG
ncbi:hypothetical protein GUITHDRAFT_113215 [Guillardia theta CCMP2712]|uniref:Uncharacterized protein n=1 Tax=Guillardia theta (strain CCMP2712) TaxID=905079 RepID=L1IWN5_GUITC|nr:hypothetical protein GUITHDRAFT_113215 [Guillardia theta CCMP2712]EKX40683.1 hypothetical protein GUITHDRAFT_113215 [Guillardia theta CCMP2712]|eukprot:XP_005827663.1 hypothetical protein GUITHDRAFT_113215 [Guillardia theta CCMP2712]